MLPLFVQLGHDTGPMEAVGFPQHGTIREFMRGYFGWVMPVKATPLLPACE